VKIITSKYHREFVIDRGRGAEHVTWEAWREPRPKVKGYGKTEEEAMYDLVHFVQPLDLEEADNGECDNVPGRSNAL